MIVRAILMALAICASAAGAKAAITELTFSGSGRVTFSQRIPGVEAGDPVQVTGYFNLGDGSRPDLAPIIPDDFTGEINLDAQALHIGYQRFSFTVWGGGVSGGSSGAVIQGATLQLRRGYLYLFSVFADYDPDVSILGNSTFYYYGSSTGSRQIRGVWEYDRPAGAVVPEPEAWALMILGFFGIGGTLRLNRKRIGRFAY